MEHFAPHGGTLWPSSRKYTISYDLKAWNDIISCVLWKKTHFSVLHTIFFLLVDQKMIFSTIES